MGSRSYLIRFCIERDEDGSLFGYCPQLEGCFADGEDMEELAKNLKEAAHLYLESLVRHGEDIPTGECIRLLGPKQQRFISDICCERQNYKELTVVL